MERLLNRRRAGDIVAHHGVHVHLNCASSLDGRIATVDGAPLALSCEHDLRRVHALRAQCDAILVGSGTVLADDPSLAVKSSLAQGPDPLRVVLDGRGRIPPSARVWRDGNALWVTQPGVPPRDGTQQLTLPAGAAGDGIDLAELLRALRDRGVTSLLVEGGSHILRSFVEADLVDCWTVYVAPMLVGDGAPGLWPSPKQGEATAHTPLHLRREATMEPLGNGWLFRIR